MNKTLSHWLSLSREELDDIYSSAQPGPIPTGDTRGTAIVTGALLPRTLARFARLFAWQGKVFDIFADDGESGVLLNKISPFGLGFIVAKVYRDASWMDQKQTIVIDYSTTSFFAKSIRDEIRQVEPGLYLGKVWWGKTRVLDFALTTKITLIPSTASDTKTTTASNKITGTESTSTSNTEANGVADTTPT